MLGHTCVIECQMLQIPRIDEANGAYQPINISICASVPEMHARTAPCDVLPQALTFLGNSTLIAGHHPSWAVRTDLAPADEEEAPDCAAGLEPAGSWVARSCPRHCWTQGAPPAPAPPLMVPCLAACCCWRPL